MSADPPLALDPNFRIELPNFEGPLDLLLYLVQKHELNVLDLPISFVTEKYLAYISVIQSLNLDIAVEYLVMAATLAHIKSKMLLPKPPEDQDDDPEEELDPRAELIRRLLEYQKYKQVAEELGARGVAGRDVFKRRLVSPLRVSRRWRPWACSSSSTRSRRLPSACRARCRSRWTPNASPFKSA